MSLLIHKPSENKNEDICSICLENINNQQCYSLPECNHCFHTNCIIHWFRLGNVNCPYCNNNGINRNTFLGRYSKERYKLFRRLARNKNAPNQLKNLVNKLRIFEKQYSDNRKLIKEKSEKEGQYKILKKEINNLEKKNKQINIKIKVFKRKICYGTLIEPLLLVKKIKKL